MRRHPQFRPQVEELESLVLLDASITLLGPATAMPGDTVSYELDVNSTNPPTDVYNFTVNWGDRTGLTRLTSKTSGAIVSHVYTGESQFTITASAINNTPGTTDQNFY